MNFQTAAQQALVARLQATFPAASPDAVGRLERLEYNLIPSLTVGQVRAATAAVARGAGGELRPQSRKDGERPRHRPPMHSVFSSATLAVNSFGPWVGFEDRLELAGKTGFDSLTFEQACPVWKGKRGAPNLDVVATSGLAVVAVESKCTEHLKPKLAKFSDKYASVRGRMNPAWRTRYDDLLAEQGRPTAERHYRYLDAAQLIKHYLGLKNTFPDQPITLLYLFWEPKGAARHPVIAAHHRELERFAEALEDDQLEFRYQNYTSLWAAWERQPPGRRNEVLRDLRGRYELSVPAQSTPGAPCT